MAGLPGHVLDDVVLPPKCCLYTHTSLSCFVYANDSKPSHKYQHLICGNFRLNDKGVIFFITCKYLGKEVT